MKKHIFVQFVFALLFVFATHLASAQTVYVTEKGKKYHKKNCTVVSEGKKGMEFAAAKKAGYEPCAVCKPEESAADKKKEAATDPKKKK